MAAIFGFKCSCCGAFHEGSPNLGFSAPDQYATLSDEQRAHTAVLSEDLCTIRRGTGTDHFIRSVLEIPIHGVDQPFVLGVWVSLSEDSFNDYRRTIGRSHARNGYFGWLCNKISFYPYSHPRPVDVVVQSGGKRPKVLMHRGDPEDDPLVIDQVYGISIARAQELAERALHGG